MTARGNGTLTRGRLNGRAPVAVPATIRVAIYTRKSVSEGLDQQFNSLDAQREAVEAYVQSQRLEGWGALPERYDDGGYTGANVDRPAFQRLLADVKAGKVDVVAVYKIDRLSRSLADFARLMELFEQHGVTFVSVTQQFNTTAPMGRLTLNILMSFAEFERQTIAERTRDKILASRGKGIWTGGRPVLGYDVVDKRLVVNEPEAERVRAVYQLYLERSSVLDVAEELQRRGWTTKTWTNARGEVVKGGKLTKDAVYSMLKNPIYAGKIRAGTEVVEGQHEAIVPVETWDTVQHLLHQNYGGKRIGASPRQNKHGAILKGLLRCACGSAMTHHFSNKDGRRRSSYVCRRDQKEGAKACPGSRVSCGEIETFVFEKIRETGRDPRLLDAAIAADPEAREARRPELGGEVRRLAAEQGRLQTERTNVVEAIGRGGPALGTLMPRLEELDRALKEATHRTWELRTEQPALERGNLDPDDLAAAMADLEPLWADLFPRERQRVLALLIEQIELDAAKGEVAITFRSGGPQAVRGGRS